MAGQKFSERAVTSSKTGGYIPVNIPIGGGLFETRRISVTNLLAGTGNEGLTILGLSGNYSYGFLEGTLLIKMTAKLLTGTPVLKVGSTFGALDIVSDGDGNGLTVLNPVSLIEINKYFDTESGIFFEVTGGTVDIRMDVIENFI